VYSDLAGTGAARRHCASTRPEGKEQVKMPRAKRESNGKNPPLAAAAWAMADDPGLPPCADRLCLWRENPHLSITTYSLKFQVSLLFSSTSPVTTGNSRVFINIARGRKTAIFRSVCFQ